jgi:hypothetical protein
MTMKQCTACDRRHHGEDALCSTCRKYQRRMLYAKDDDSKRNPAVLSIQRTRWKNHGKYAPPFKSNTPEYMNWYRDVQAQARRHMDIPWAEFYARAKEEAHNNPVSTRRKYRRHRSLFGGRGTKEYNAWYYSVKKAHAALPTHEQNWPEFFDRARTKAMIEHGLMANERNNPALQGKQHHVAPLVVVPQPQSTDVGPLDGPLMFDFTLDNTEDTEP